MRFDRMIMERESPEELGYDKIKNNLTESSVCDVSLNYFGIEIDVADLLLCYGDHSGLPELRETIAERYDGVGPDNVLVTTGACLALFLVNATLLDRDDRILVLHPNYATNIEVPRSLEFNLDLFKLDFDNGFRLDVAELERRITPETRLISVTYPHNPTGVMISEAELHELVRIAEERRIHLLVDETYRELTMGQRLPTASSLSPRAISVESMSKAFGIPGVRIGWLATADAELKERFLAAKEQVCICNSILDEEVASAVLRSKDELLGKIRAANAESLAIVRGWMSNEDAVEWVEPSGGVVCFPRIRPDLDVDIAEFHRLLNDEHGTYLGPGRWFGFDDRYFRIGYAWPKKDELRAGLDSISASIQAAAR